MSKKPRLIWRKTPDERGLAHVGQSPRGFEGRIDGQKVCSVAASGGGYLGPLQGWYWYGWNVNTYCTKPLFDTREEARDDATKFYKESP